MSESREIIVPAQAQNYVELIQDFSNGFFCSLPSNTDAEIDFIYNVSATNTKLKSFINQEINMVDIYVETVEMVNEDTGEVTRSPRCIIIDDKGVAYASVSKGVYTSLRKILALRKMPSTWERPIKIIPRLHEHKRGQVLTLEIVPTGK